MKRRAIVLAALLLIGVLVAGTALAESSQAPALQDATPTPLPEEEVEEETAEEATAESEATEETGADAEMAAAEAPEAYITLNLEAGFPLDPFLVSVNAGGAQAASDLDPACSGYINSEPTVTVDWEGETEFLEAFFYSDHDPVLVVELPDGSYVCNDDANDLLLDPVVELTDLSTGRYNFWVGGYSVDQLIPGLFVLTTRSEINVGSFNAGALIRRQAIPEDLMEHEEVAPGRERLLAAIEAAEITLHEQEDFVGGVTQAVTSEGEVPAFELPADGAICAGFIAEAPDYSFDLQSAGDHLRIFFEGDQDATLVVSTPDGTLLCKDDFIAGDNLNPLLDIPAPELGRYDIFVGRVDLTQPLSGELTIVESSDEQPDDLDPASDPETN